MARSFPRKRIRSGYTQAPHSCRIRNRRPMKTPPQPGDFLKPILPGKGDTDYERYLRTDELLSLQKPAGERLHPDEHTFQIVHQSSELLLRGAHNELDRARIHINQGDLQNAARLLRRANSLLQYPIDLLHVLDSLTP